MNPEVVARNEMPFSSNNFVHLPVHTASCQQQQTFPFLVVREFAFAKGDSEQVQSQSGRYHEGMNSSWSRIVRFTMQNVESCSSTFTSLDSRVGTSTSGQCKFRFINLQHNLLGFSSFSLSGCCFRGFIMYICLFGDDSIVRLVISDYLSD